MPPQDPSQTQIKVEDQYAPAGVAGLLPSVAQARGTLPANSGLQSFNQAMQILPLLKSVGMTQGAATSAVPSGGAAATPGASPPEPDYQGQINSLYHAKSKAQQGWDQDHFGGMNPGQFQGYLTDLDQQIQNLMMKAYGVGGA